MWSITKVCDKKSNINSLLMNWSIFVLCLISMGQTVGLSWNRLNALNTSKVNQSVFSKQYTFLSFLLKNIDDYWDYVSFCNYICHTSYKFFAGYTVFQANRIRQSILPPVLVSNIHLTYLQHPRLIIFFLIALTL